MSQQTLVILCGGQSRRLGTDKGLYRPLGETSMLVRGLHLWGDHFAEVIVSVKDDQQKRLYQQEIGLHVPSPLAKKITIVCDESHSASPYNATLIGIVSALEAAQNDTVCTVAVDQVGVRATHLKRLSELSEETPAHAYCFASEDEFLPLPSIWRKSALHYLNDLIASGSLSVRIALEVVKAESMDASPFADELALNANDKKTMDTYFGQPLKDAFNRRIKYLRFSLTEACNLSCQYCLPKGFPEWYRHKAKLSLPAIENLLKGFRSLGFSKVRFTGGEPTVHPKCFEAITMARKIGFEEIALTTNGLLIDNIKRYHEAGLTQVNVSLDSIDEAEFYECTGSKKLKTVLDLVDEASQIMTTKINAVLLREVNGSRESIERFIDWALERPVTLRFIELMETKLNGSFSGEQRVLGTEIIPLLQKRGLTQSSKKPNFIAKGPADDWSSPLFEGKIGLINPMSCNFCADCNRLRVRANGHLKMCLFGDNDHPLPIDDSAAIAEEVMRVIGAKPERHYLEDHKTGNVSTFRTIGG